MAKKKPTPKDLQQAKSQDSSGDTPAKRGALEIAGIKLPVEGLEVLKAGDAKLAATTADPTEGQDDQSTDAQQADEPGQSSGNTGTQEADQSISDDVAGQDADQATSAPDELPEEQDPATEPQGEAANEEQAGRAPAPDGMTEEGPDADSKSDLEKEIEAQMMAQFAEADVKQEGGEQAETVAVAQESATPDAAPIQMAAAPVGAMPQGHYIQPNDRSVQTSIVRMLLLFNAVLAGCLILVVFWVRPWEPRVATGYQQAPMVVVQSQPQPAVPSLAKQIISPGPVSNVDQTQKDSDDADQRDWATALSWPEAERAFFRHQHDVAQKGYQALLRQSDTQVANERVSDFLRLRVAQCLMGRGQTDQARRMLISATDSSSPIVRAMGYYQLAASDLLGGQHLRARMQAYLAIATIAVLGSPMAMEADCDFLIAKALSQKVFTYHNEGDPVAWHQRRTSDPFAGLGESELRRLLDRGIGLLEQNILGPEIMPSESEAGGRRFSARCTRSTVEEFLTQLSAETGMDIKWQSVSPEARGRAVSIRCRQASEQRLAEVVCGAVGLMARFTGDSILVYDPRAYTSLAEQRTLVSSEATSVWRRLSIRASGDPRLSEGHFALAVLQEYDGNDMTAVKEYQLIAQQFAREEVAAAALVRSARVRIRLRDYSQARLDLLDLLNRFPNYPYIDRVYLYLGKATMNANLLKEAIGVYRKLYYMNHTTNSRRQACLGATRCFWLIGDAEQTVTWATRYIGLVAPPDDGLAEACMLLGRSEALRGNYPESVAAYYHALAAGPLPARRIDALIELAGVHTKSGHFVEAVASLDRLGSMKLSAAQTCQYALKSAQVYRTTGMADRAVAILRRYLGTVTDPEMRADLKLALANSYVEDGKLDMAGQVLADSLPDMPPGKTWRQSACRLAEICFDLGKTDQAGTLAKELRNASCPPEIRTRASQVLGSVYIIKQDYDRAAMVFSGLDLPRQDGDQRKTVTHSPSTGGQTE